MRLPDSLFRLARGAGWLPALGLAAACAVRSDPDWATLLAEVRAQHPGVPQLGVSELAARSEADAPLLLDARGKEEFDVSHLHRARWTPDVESALAQLAGVAPEREIVVYCSVGVRSSALAEALQSRGYSHVANLEGGIFAWANAGLPTWRGDEPVPAVHPFDARWGTLLVPERRAR